MPRIVLRVGLLVSGLTGFWWAATALPIFLSASPVHDIISRIVADERLRPDLLSEMLVHIEGTSTSLVAESSVSRAKALIRLELAEKAIRRPDGMDDGDRQVLDAERDLKFSLGQNPNDSFQWMLLYSVVMTRNGFDPVNIKYLVESYQMGPREGWIALRRNQLALGGFPFLDDALRRAVIAEFAQIVDADFSGEAALILKGVGWVYREELLLALEKADLVSRENLYRRLAADGLKLKIPDIAYDERPWR
ncbi:hypothetical protein [Bradyrhizobium yuanmingense]|uniref:hypothetical protein n=1 Tax=Bradyrhizobium yuanmingense TaxID=108015 RepID=UPI0023B9E72A|nr:hypothetical protein [Bradyrhizobium yuanmingense]MDF0578879.1 hypothetical protein [Bradyrhizobium yuanmingense]